MNKEEIVKFLDDPQTIDHLKNLETEDGIVSYLHENGIDISTEKASELIKIFKLFEKENGEILEEDLERISGGASIAKTAAGIILGTIALTAGGKFLHDVNEESQGGLLKVAGEVTNSVGEAAVDKAAHIGSKIKSTYKKAVRTTAEAFKE